MCSSDLPIVAAMQPALFLAMVIAPWQAPAQVVADGARVRAGGITHRLRREGTLWTLLAEVPGEGGERPLWSTALEECLPTDLLMGNHFTATWPASPFRHRLTLRVLTPTGRLSVLNQEVTVRDGRVVQRWALRDRGALCNLLKRQMGIDLPEVLSMPVPSVPGWD